MADRSDPLVVAQLPSGLDSNTLPPGVGGIEVPLRLTSDGRLACSGQTLASLLEVVRAANALLVVQATTMEVASSLVGRVRPSDDLMMISYSDRAVSLALARGFQAGLCADRREVLEDLAPLDAMLCPALRWAHELSAEQLARAYVRDADLWAAHQRQALDELGAVPMVASLYPERLVAALKAA